MREVTDRARLENFLSALSRNVEDELHVYLVGGATALLYGWRATTLDVDMRLVPDSDAALHALSTLKDALKINIELASPLDFIPVRDDWQLRSPFVAQHRRLFVHHFDLDAQALAKIERDHVQDNADVRAMLGLKLVTPKSVRDYFSAIEPKLYRYPALDAQTFRASMERALTDYEEQRREKDTSLE